MKTISFKVSDTLHASFGPKAAASGGGMSFVLTRFMESFVEGDLIVSGGKVVSPTQVSAAQIGPSVATAPSRGRPPTPKSDPKDWPSMYPPVPKNDFLRRAMDPTPLRSDIARAEYTPPPPGKLPPGVTDPMEREAVEAWRTLSWGEQQDAKQEGNRDWYVRYRQQMGELDASNT